MLLAVGDRRPRALRPRLGLDARAPAARRRAARLALAGRQVPTRSPPPTPTSTPRGRCCVAARRFDRPALAREARAHRPRRRSQRDRARGAAGACSSPARGRAAGRSSTPATSRRARFALLGQRDLRASGLRVVRALQAHRSGLAPDWAHATPGGATPIGKPDDPGGAGRLQLRRRAHRRSAWPRTARRRCAARRPGRAPRCSGRSRRCATSAARRWRPASTRSSPSPPRRPPPPRATASARPPSSTAPRGPMPRTPATTERRWVALGRVMLTTRWLRGCPPM